jgi:hypothetical protein
MPSVLDQITDSTRRLTKRQRVQLVGRIVKETPLSKVEKSNFIAMIVGELFGSSIGKQSTTQWIRDYQRLLELMPTAASKRMSHSDAEKNIPQYEHRRELVFKNRKFITICDAEIEID